MLISPMEILDIGIITVFMGIIFSDIFKVPRIERERYEPLTKDLKYRKHYRSILGINLNDFKNAAMIIAPAIILHEFGHKFVATAFGLKAVFHAAYRWLGLGLIMKIMRFGFIIFVPAFVEITGNASKLQYALVAVAGPLVNLALWLISSYILKKKHVKEKYKIMLLLSARINMFLFIFNMLPIPPFDGFKFFYNLFTAIF